MARPKTFIPGKDDYNKTVAVVEVEVSGQYVAAVGDRGKVAKKYKIVLRVPQGFTASDLKRLIPRQLMKDEDKYADFVGLRTFELNTEKAPRRVPADPKAPFKLGDFYNEMDRKRFDRLRTGREAYIKQEKSKYLQLYGSLEGFDEATGMPAFDNTMPSTPAATE